ncbi:MAG: dehypoxanthine futalosine cyclase [Vampirovibrionales bacterium]|nr:dehypoxanthine futalosine cyclase [Vampirovibrionales bacterium]
MPFPTAADAPALRFSQRVDGDQALKLFRETDLLTLAAMAETVKARFHDPDAPYTFIIDRNVNYTNICNVDCLFCAFYRHADAPDAYTLTYEEIHAKAQELVTLGGTQLLLQGGVNPALPFEYYLDLLRQLRRDFPALTLHAFSPTEIAFMAEQTGQTLRQTLLRLQEAGLSSLPGAGGEILHDDIRRRVSRKKVNTEDWLGVMEAAHELGLKTSATMMFGMMESDWHIVDHLLQIRALQDRSGGFISFIPWTFQRENTALARLTQPPPDGLAYLRVTALARLVLDNIPNIGASWITQGMKLGQVALTMGANDMGGLLLEENVVTQAGATPTTKSVAEMVKAIHASGRDAAQRDTQYAVLKRFTR